jgi:hypothetical protein
LLSGKCIDPDETLLDLPPCNIGDRLDGPLLPVVMHCALQAPVTVFLLFAHPGRINDSPPAEKIYNIPTLFI